MRYTGRIRKAIMVILIGMILLFTMNIAISLISGHHINEGSSTIRSDQDLTCYLTIWQDSPVNITWYKNGVQNITAIIASCTTGTQCHTSLGSGTVPNGYITRGDEWICSASYYNGTSSEYSNVSATIVDSPPQQPRIFWSNGTEIINTTVVFPEDSTTIFNVTSTDKDGDPITYITNDTAFCSINSATGRLTCTPSQMSHVGLRTIRLGADTSFATTYQFLDINVTPVNGAPYFSPSLSDQNLNEGQAFNYIIIGADRENNWPYNVSILSISPSIGLNLTRINNYSFMLMLDSNRTATFGEAQKNYTVNLSIVDTDNITSNSKNTSAVFRLIGVSYNHVPNISYVVYNNNSITQGGNLSIYINATDMDNDTITFTTDSTIYPITYSSATDHNSFPNASFAYAWINLTGLNNTHVITHNFSVYVFDTKDNAIQAINFKVINTNDMPIIYETSNNTLNTLNNYNMSRLIAYTGVLLDYQVNATDVDDLTYDAANTGLGTYSTNDSRFNVSSITGILNFIPSVFGNFTFKVSVIDRAGWTYNRTANVEVLTNHDPSFTQIPIVLHCKEYDAANWPNACYYNVSANVTDADLADHVAQYWTNSTIFTIGSSNGIINFNASQSMVGNHSILLNITDTRGGMNSTIINVTIDNTNNPPVISTVDLPSGNMVVGHVYQIIINASDPDLSLQGTYENLTFSENVTGPNIAIFSINKISSSQAIISIVPSVSGDTGNYTVNISVIDYYGNVSRYTITGLSIYNQTVAPNITSIIPSGTPLNDTINNDSWVSTSYFPGMTTDISIYENKTYTFDQISFADTRSQPNHLDYYWYYDNTLVSTGSSYPKYFDFFSSGTHNLTFIGIDQYGSNASFNWNVNVNNVNRAPIYYNYSLENLTVGGSISIADYMVFRNSQARFYDPDDDPSGRGYNLGNDTSMSFNATSCPYATFSFLNATLVINAQSTGMCNVIFTATDGLNSSLHVSSQLVSINITNVSDNVEQIIQQVVVQNSGGGTNTQVVPIPMPEEVEKPRPLHIITPNLVTVYKNSTIKIPLLLNNTWNSTLYDITLEAVTNATNVSIHLDNTYIPQLDKGESMQVILTIDNYKSEGHYEVKIIGNVTTPLYTDTATILINSADMNSEGDALESKISFARDLLSNNPECQELNELLIQAKKELSNNNYAGTAKIVDNVINGCKYLVNNKKPVIEQPRKNFLQLFEWQSIYTSYIVIGIFVICFIIALYYVFKKENPEQNF